MCVCTATAPHTVTGANFSAGAGILPPPLWRGSLFWSSFVTRENGASWPHKTFTRGWRKGLWEGHRLPLIWPPVTSRSGVLIMEPVNANNTRLPEPQELSHSSPPPPPPPLSVSSPSLSLTLNYHYWALGTQSSPLHLSDVEHWRALSHPISTSRCSLYLQPPRIDGSS